MNLASKFTAILDRQKDLLDDALVKAIREGRANLVQQGGYSGADNVFLHRQHYKTDILERQATLIDKLSRLLAE